MPALDVQDELVESVCAALLEVETIRELAAEKVLLDELRVLADLLQHAMNDVLDLVAGLRPTAEDTASLGTRIESYLRELETRCDLRISLEVDGENDALSPSAQIAVFRIVQESLTNICKHAKTPSASVSLVFEPEVVVCRVIDKGVGFDPSATGPNGYAIGHGLRGMKERAELLDGRLDVQSAPGAGTTVTVRIPIWRQSWVQTQGSRTPGSLPVSDRR